MMKAVWVIITVAVSGPYGMSDPNIGSIHVTEWVDKEGRNAPNAFFSEEECLAALTWLRNLRAKQTPYIYQLRTDCHLAKVLVP